MRWGQWIEESGASMLAQPHLALEPLDFPFLLQALRSQIIHLALQVIDLGLDPL